MRDIGYALAGFGAYFIIYALLVFNIMSQLFPQIDTDQKQELGFSTSLAGPELIFVFFSLVILPPLVEELLVRGFLYTGLRSKLPVIYAAVITSIVFAAAHLQWGSGNALLWTAAADTFVLSMVLIWLRQKTGSLWPGIGAHFIKNGIAFLALFIFKVA
jgi:membrane protease YdiL (CAAX protease family)